MAEVRGVTVVVAIIQTLAAIVQAVAAAMFLWGVVQQRRDALVNRLLQQWAQTTQLPAPTPWERQGAPYSQRQIDYVNDRLGEAGHRWRWRGNGGQGHNPDRSCALVRGEETDSRRGR